MKLVNNEDKILAMLEKMDSRLERLEGDVSTLKGDVSTLKGDVSILKEGQAEIRDTVNRLAEWADECGYVVKFPLPKL